MSRVTRRDFSRALNDLAGLKPAIVDLTLGDETVTVFAETAASQVTSHVPAVGDTKRKVAVPYRLLRDLVRVGPAELELTATDGKLSLWPGTEIGPAIERDWSDGFTWKPFCTVGVRDLQAAVRRVAPSASTNPIGRAALSGIHLSQDGGDLRLATADGFRLAVARVPMVWRGQRRLLPNAREMAAIVPRLRGETVAIITATINEAPWVGLDTLTQTFWVPNIEATFPDVGTVLRETTGTAAAAAIVPAGQLLAVTRAAEPVCKNDRAVEMWLVPGQVRIEPDTSSLEDDDVLRQWGAAIPAERAGADMGIGVNVTFLRDVVASLPAHADVTINLKSHDAALWLTAGGTTWVIMPMITGVYSPLPKRPYWQTPEAAGAELAHG